jgi:hypothetical protein
MSGMLYIRVMEAMPKDRNPIQKHCWNRGHKVIPDKKKKNNKLKCRQKNRTARDYSNGPLSFRRYILWP